MKLSKILKNIIYIYNLEWETKKRMFKMHMSTPFSTTSALKIKKIFLFFLLGNIFLFCFNLILDILISDSKKDINKKNKY